MLFELESRLAGFLKVFMGSRDVEVSVAELSLQSFGLMLRCMVLACAVCC